MSALDAILRGRAQLYSSQAAMQLAQVVDGQMALLDVGAGSFWCFVLGGTRTVSAAVLAGNGGQWVLLSSDPTIPTFGRHALIANTVGLWQGNESLLDTSGNALTLSWQNPGSGQVDRYGELYPGYYGFANDANNNRGAFRDATDAALRITGDMTLQFVAIVDTRATIDRWLVAHGVEGGDATEANNYLYGVKYSNNAQTGGLEWHQEFSTGTDSNFAPGNVNSSVATSRPILPHQTPFYFTATRTSNVIQFYLNGKPWGPVSNALTTPTGGTNGKLYILCGSDGSPMYGAISSVRILNVTRSAANVLADYNSTLGLVYGTRA